MTGKFPIRLNGLVIRIRPFGPQDPATQKASGAAAREVRKLSGVPGSVNNITLAPTTRKVDIRQRVMNAPKRHAEVEANRVDVDVDCSGSVKLSSLVDDWEERRAAGRTAWPTPGMRSVADNIHMN